MPSRSPCTSPRPTSACPSTTSRSPSGGSRTPEGPAPPHDSHARRGPLRRATARQPNRAPVSRAVLSMGANLGDRAAALRAAITALEDDGVLVARSTLYETPPWGPVDQPPYPNAVVV